MPSRGELEAYRRSQKRLTEAAERELRALVRLLPEDPAAARREILEIFPAITQAYGEAGLAVTMEWLDQVSPDGLLKLSLGDVVNPDQAAATASWAARHIEVDRSQMMSLLAGAMQRYTMAPGRDTIRKSAARSRARYARVPSGADPCAFCLMLASRGAVYESEETAAAPNGTDNYHDRCWCVPTILFKGEPMPDGYDPEALYGLYMSGRSAVGKKFPSTAEILAAMREMHGMR